MPRQRFLCFALLMGFFAASSMAGDAEKIDFHKQVKPILESACVKCHGVQRWSGEVRVDEKEFIFGTGENGRVTVPGKPLQSTLYTTSAADDKDPLAMPPRDRGKMSTLQLQVIYDWIQQGAEWPDGVVLKRVDRIESIIVASIIQVNCLKCHAGEKAISGIRLDDKKYLFEVHGDKTLVIPFEPEKSLLVKSLQKPSVHDNHWPKFLTDEDMQTLRGWIEQGAPWTDGHEFSPNPVK